MPHLPSRKIHLEAASNGARRWRQAQMTPDEIAGLITLAYREGLSKRRTVTFEIGQVVDYTVEMRPNPFSRVYEMALVMLLIMVFSGLLARTGLEDTMVEPMVELGVLLAGGALAYAASRVIRMPVIRLELKAEALPPAQAVSRPSVLAPPSEVVRWALRDRIRREMRRQGRELSDAELDEIIQGTRDLPAPAQEALGRVNALLGDLSPSVYRISGSIWDGVAGTRRLAVELEQALAARRAPIAPASFQQIDWQRSEKLWLASLGISVLVVMAVIAATLGQIISGF